MTAPKTGWAQALAMLSTVDWPRTLHRAGLLLRALRGDETIDHDSEQIKHTSFRVRQSFEKMGRQAVGCIAPAPCSCPFCEEERESRKP